MMVITYLAVGTTVVDGSASDCFFDLRNVCIKAVETNSVLFVRFLVENAQDRKINNRVHSRFREFLPNIVGGMQMSLKFAFLPLCWAGIPETGCGLCC